MTTIPSPLHVVDLHAWNQFCDLIANGGGVSDHPNKADAPVVHASNKFFQLEINRVEHHRNNLIPFLLDHCKLTGKDVLEFGAGTAGLSVAMVQAGIRSVQGVEPVAINCEAGRWRVRAYDMENHIHFHHLPDTRHLPFSGQSFDAVVVSSVLQYIPDYEQRRQLLTEMARVLRPGGQLIFSSSGNGIYPAGPHSGRWWSNLFPHTSGRLGYDRGISYWEFNKILMPLGFSVDAQNQSAFDRWQQRIRLRKLSTAKRLAAGFALGLLRWGSRLLSRLTGAPMEAFMPYLDLNYRLKSIPVQTGSQPETRQAASTRTTSSEPQSRYG